MNEVTTVHEDYPPEVLGLNVFILACIHHTHNTLHVDWVESRSLLEPSPNI